jgi:hypothetical protein
MQRNPLFDPCPKPFTGPSFEFDDVEAAQGAIRQVIRRFRRARCAGARVRPRQAARRRREQRRRATNSSRGDPDSHLDDDAAALLAAIDEAGGRDDFGLNRATFCVFHEWDFARWRGAQRGDRSRTRFHVR